MICKAYGNGWECDREAVAKGLCRAHRLQEQRNPTGDFTPIQDRRSTVEAELDPLVTVTTKIPASRERSLRDAAEKRGQSLYDFLASILLRRSK